MCFDGLDHARIENGFESRQTDLDGLDNAGRENDARDRDVDVDVDYDDDGDDDRDDDDDADDDDGDLI